MESSPEMPNFDRVKENFMKKISGDRRRVKKNVVKRTCLPPHRRSGGQTLTTLLESDRKHAVDDEFINSLRVSAEGHEELTPGHSTSFHSGSSSHTHHPPEDGLSPRPRHSQSLLLDPAAEARLSQAVLTASNTLFSSSAAFPMDVDFSRKTSRGREEEEDDVCNMGEDALSDSYDDCDNDDEDYIDDIDNAPCGDEDDDGDDDGDDDENGSDMRVEVDPIVGMHAHDRYGRHERNDLQLHEEEYLDFQSICCSTSSASSDSSSCSSESFGTKSLSGEEDEDQGHNYSCSSHSSQEASGKPSLSHSRLLLIRLLKMQALSVKGPLYSQYGRTLYSHQGSPRSGREETVDAFYCSSSAEAAIADATAEGRLKGLLRAQLDMLLRVKSLLPLEDGGSFITTSTGSSASLSPLRGHRRSFVASADPSSPGSEVDDVQVNPFHGNSLAHVIQMLTDTLSTIDQTEHDEEVCEEMISGSANWKQYRYANCSDSFSSPGKGTESKLCAQLQVTAGSLAVLSLVGRVLRAEQRIVALRRLHHEKSSRLTECEDELLDRVERAHRGQLEVDQLKLRVRALQESLGYHRAATERIRSLEVALTRAEEQKQAALATLASTESQLKQADIRRDMGRRSLRGRGGARGVSRLQADAYAMYSDDDETEDEQGGNHASVRRERDMPEARSERWLREETKGDDLSRCSAGGSRKQESKENADHSLIRLLAALEAGATSCHISSCSDEDLARMSSSLSALTGRVEEAKRLSMQRKEKELADSKLSSAENSLCCICRDNSKTILLLPCRHLCLCENCSEALQQRRGACPVCREEVRDTLRVYA